MSAIGGVRKGQPGPRHLPKRRKAGCRIPAGILPAARSVQPILQNSFAIRHRLRILMACLTWSLCPKPWLIAMKLDEIVTEASKLTEEERASFA